MSDNKGSKKFFDDLKDLFLTSILITSKKGEKKILRLDKLNTNATLQKNFTYNFGSLLNLSGYTYQNDTASTNILRNELYYDYEMMDRDSMIAAALDIYAEEATSRNIEGQTLSIETENLDIKNSLEQLFYNVLNIDFNLASWVRNLVKYGDFFLKLDIVEKIGIINAHALSPYAVERIENWDDAEDQVLFKYNYNIGGLLPFSPESINQIKNTVILKEYEVAHFRLLSDTRFLPYGKSILEIVRRDWKRLNLLEDAMMIHRILRAPDKRILKIDVGNLAPEEVDDYIEKIVNNIKRAPLIDEKTGEYNMYFNVMNMLEDLVIPIRGGNSGTEIETLPGLTYEAIDDINYIKNKILSGLKIPATFLNFEDNVGDSGALTTQDVRFAKTIERIQKIVESELLKIAMIHLYTQGFDLDDISNFSLRLTRSSQIAELNRLEIIDQRISVASSMKDLQMFSYDYILKTIFNMTDREIEEERNKVLKDKNWDYRYEQMQNDGKDPLTEPSNENEENENNEMNFESLDREIMQTQNYINNLAKQQITKLDKYFKSKNKNQKNILNS